MRKEIAQISFIKDSLHMLMEYWLFCVWGQNSAKFWSRFISSSLEIFYITDVFFFFFTSCHIGNCGLHSYRVDYASNPGIWVIESEHLKSQDNLESETKFKNKKSILWTTILVLLWVSVRGWVWRSSLS